MKKQFKCTLSSPPLHVGYSKKNIPAIERGSDLEMMTEDNFITEDKEEEGKVMKSGKQRQNKEKKTELQSDLQDDFKRSETCSTQVSFRCSLTDKLQSEKPSSFDNMNEHLKEYFSQFQCSDSQKQLFTSSNFLHFFEYIMEYKLGNKGSYSSEEQKNSQKRKKNKIIKETMRKNTTNIFSSGSFSAYEDFCREKGQQNDDYKCDGCGIDPIIGPRFHCSSIECEDDFDLCQRCHRRTNHKHELQKVEGNLVMSAISQIKSNLLQNRSHLTKSKKITTKNIKSSIY